MRARTVGTDGATDRFAPTLNDLTLFHNLDGNNSMNKISTILAAIVMATAGNVAMAHGDATTSYRPLSTPLVNIRVTLSTACSDGVFSRETAEHYLDLAKRRFYPERSYGQLLADAKIVAELEQTVADFARWLGPQFERAIDQKRIDAALLLETVTNNDLPAAEAEPFAFAHTEAFHELRKRTGSQRVPRSR